MIYDIFTFFNELDVLEARLNILDSVVDKFVIVEATETFSGVPKKLYYLENKDRFLKWESKIIHYVVKDISDELIQMAKSSPNTGKGEHYWVREFCQKESIKNALVGLSYEDICFVSDVDEIWNTTVVDCVKGEHVYKLKQLPYLYYFNNRTSEDWHGWTGTIVTKYKNIKDACLNHLRTDSMTDYVVVDNGGWHFNAIGGRETKQSAFKHPIYEVNEEWRRREIEMRKDESQLPQYLLGNKNKWQHLFR